MCKNKWMTMMMMMMTMKTVTREQRMQRITFAAKTNAADTHTYSVTA